MANSTLTPPLDSPRKGKSGWAHFHHEADTGIRGTGARPERAFEQAALAMVAVISDPQSVNAVETVEMRCTAPNLELLLVDWLNAIVFEMATRKMLFGSFRVRIEGNELRGMALGEAIDAGRHRPAVEVKGATMSELQVKEADSGEWIAQCVVDV